MEDWSKSHGGSAVSFGFEVSCHQFCLTEALLLVSVWLDLSSGVFLTITTFSQQLEMYTPSPGKRFLGSLAVCHSL